MDVRRTAAFETNPVLIAGAIRVLPEQVTEWALQNGASKPVPVLAYCAHGHEVSQSAAAALRAHGFAATYLAGGIAGWQEQGRRTEPGPV